MDLENSGSLGREVEEDFNARAEGFTSVEERKNAFTLHMSWDGQLSHNAEQVWEAEGLVAGGWYEARDVGVL